MDLLEGLNTAQKQVVCTAKGPILVLAGAGSGKTKALTHRIAYLISHEKVSPERILAITFTNKAACEMKHRVEALIRDSKLETRNSPTMGTFHSVCARILRRDADKIGKNRSFVIFDEDDAVKVIKNCLKKIGIGDLKISPSGIKAKISGAKNELMEPEEFAKLITGQNADLIIEVYKRYQAELNQNDAFDFDDLLFYTVKLFQTNPEVLEKYQSLWQYLLIDEYQDTNQAQYLFAKLLAEKSRNICAVGDDWQSIYSWRGANFQNILNFERDWPETIVVKLEQNYRSSKAILNAAQNVIEQNEKRSKKTLWTDNPAGNLIVTYEARNEEDEADFIVREAQRLMVQGESLSEMAVFYRTNAQSRAVEEKLVRSRMPYKIVGGIRFYERKEIKDILAWLRVASGANDWISFERSLGAPLSGVGQQSFSKLKQIAEERNLKIKDIVRNDYVASQLTPRIFGFLETHFEKIRTISKSFEISLHNGIETAIKTSGYRDFLSDGTFQNEERLENLNELLSVAEEYEKTKPGITLVDFLEEVALFSDLDNYKDSSDGLTLMTLHTAKGLEYKTVFIVGLEENIFPHSRSLFDVSELEEERRLFYVGITRAKERLYLLYGVSRMYFGSIQTNPPSRFIGEIPPALLTNSAGASGHEEKKLTDDNIPGNFKEGDIIEHENYGRGKVKAVFDDELTVFFPSLGEEKVLSVYYAPIRKV